MADQGLAECRIHRHRSDCFRKFYIDEEPPHTVDLPAFYMDKYEVTNAFYQACVDAGVCQPPISIKSNRRDRYYGNSQFDNSPVIYVDWNMAKTYCEWRGARLPSEAEWEKAARGTEGRTYPWGEGIDCDKANCTQDTTPVGSYGSGKSPYGIYDMAGNVSEWVLDWYDVYPGGDPTAIRGWGQKFRVLRGGYWNYFGLGMRVSDRFWGDPTERSDHVGFRCAFSQ
jgi:formylglycine-generating enzyme required for sulfatase activity